MLEHYHKNDIIFLPAGLDIPHSHLLFHTCLLRLYLTILSSVSPQRSIGAGARQSRGQWDRPEARLSQRCGQQGHLGRPVRHGAGRLQAHHRNQIRPAPDAPSAQGRSEGPPQSPRTASSRGSQAPGRSPGELPGGTWSVSDIKLPCQWAEQPAITTSHASVNWQ